MISDPEYRQIAAARDEIVGVGKKQTLGMALGRADALQDLQIRQACSVVRNVSVCIQHAAKLPERPAFDDADPALAELAFGDDLQ